jgi:hypothetical protein
MRIEELDELAIADVANGTKTNWSRNPEGVGEAIVKIMVEIVAIVLLGSFALTGRLVAQVRLGGVE